MNLRLDTNGWGDLRADPALLNRSAYLSDESGFALFDASNIHLVLEDVVNQSRHGQNRFVISMQTPVDYPISTIETFALQFSLTQNEAEVVKQAFYLEQGGTMFHVINSFTRAAKQIELSAAELEVRWYGIWRKRRNEARRSGRRSVMVNPSKWEMDFPIFMVFISQTLLIVILIKF